MDATEFDLARGSGISYYSSRRHMTHRSEILSVLNSSCRSLTISCVLKSSLLKGRKGAGHQLPLPSSAVETYVHLLSPLL